MSSPTRRPRRSQRATDRSGPPFCADHVLRAGSGLDHLLDVALLVDADRLKDLEDLLETYAEAAHERIRMRLLGPMAPYDFVDPG